MEDIINMIMNNGMGAVLLAYFIYKDNKFNGHITTLLSEVKEVLVELRSWMKPKEE